jgi:hypothetical protein
MYKREHRDRRIFGKDSGKNAALATEGEVISFRPEFATNDGEGARVPPQTLDPFYAAGDLKSSEFYTTVRVYHCSS